MYEIYEGSNITKNIDIESFLLLEWKFFEASFYLNLNK